MQRDRASTRDAALSKGGKWGKANFDLSLPSYLLISCWYLPFAKLYQEQANKNANRERRQLSENSGQKRVKKKNMEWTKRRGEDVGKANNRYILQELNASLVKKYPVSFGGEKDYSTMDSNSNYFVVHV